MKMTKETYRCLRMHFKTIVDLAGGTERVHQYYKDKSRIRMLWDVYWAARRTIQRVASGEFANTSTSECATTLRELDDLKDTHIDTALKTMAREFLL